MNHPASLRAFLGTLAAGLLVAAVGCQSLTTPDTITGGSTGNTDTSGDDSTGGDDTTGDTDSTDGDDSTTDEGDSFLPTSISLDVDELPETDSSRPVPQESHQAAHLGRNIVHWFQNAADRIFFVGRTITSDMSDPNQTQVEGEFDFDGQLVPYACDFAPFDVDGDGTADGSGNSYTEPVAFRIWTDNGGGYEQFMCGLITTLPTPENVGAGVVYAHPSAADPTATEDMQVFIEWDRTNADHKWNQSYVSGTLSGEDGVILNMGHARVDQRSTDLGTEKTVRTAADFDTHPNNWTSDQVAVHWLRGGTAILVSAISTGGPDNFDLTNSCVSLTTFAELTGGECDDFDTQDMTYLDVPIGGENDFPVEFSSSPSF